MSTYIEGKALADLSLRCQLYRHLGNGDTTHRQTVITLAVIRHNGGQGAGQTDTARIVGLSDINRTDLARHQLYLDYKVTTALTRDNQG